MAKINVNNREITIVSINDKDYTSLTVDNSKNKYFVDLLINTLSVFQLPD